MAQALICESCGTPNPPDALRCSLCGDSLASIVARELWPGRAQWAHWTTLVNPKDDRTFCATCGERNAVDADRCITCEEPLGEGSLQLWPRVDMSRWPAVIRWPLTFVAFVALQIVLGQTARWVSAATPTVRSLLDIVSVVAFDIAAIKIAAYIAPSYRKTVGYVFATVKIAQYVSVIALWFLRSAPQWARPSGVLDDLYYVAGLAASVAAIVLIRNDDRLSGESTRMAGIGRLQAWLRWLLVFTAIPAALVPIAFVLALNWFLPMVSIRSVAPSVAVAVAGAVLVAVAAYFAPTKPHIVAWIAALSAWAWTCIVTCRMVVAIIGLHGVPLDQYAIGALYALSNDLALSAGAAIAASAVSAAERRR